MSVRTSAAAFAGRLAALLSPVTDFVYPPVCLACRERLEEPGSLVCPACLSRIPTVDASNRVWSAVHASFRAEGCVDDFLTCFLFEKGGTLQELVHLLKYGGFRRVGATLGTLLGRRALEHPDYHRADLIVPVPLHSLRRRERGYNQSEIIAESMSAVLGIACRPKALGRVRFTRSQTELSLSSRRRNVDGAFEVAAGHSCAGRSVILVDDVVTTGATIVAAARALRAGGAARVLAASVAVAE